MFVFLFTTSGGSGPEAKLRRVLEVVPSLRNLKNPKGDLESMTLTWIVKMVIPFPRYGAAKAETSVSLIFQSLLPLAIILPAGLKATL